jgi:hypothetical protein
MFEINWDFSEMIAYAGRLGAATEQIPFALALAMNEAADNTRNLLVKSTWPGHVRQRNQSFIAASLTTKGARANKRLLEVEIYDRLNRGNLQMQAKGGTRTPHGGGNLAVPLSNIPKGSRGVPKRLRPRNLKTAVRKGDALYARDSKTGRLRLLYVLKPATKIPKRVPFYEDFALAMSVELQRTIPKAVERAMATAKR